MITETYSGPAWLHDFDDEAPTDGCEVWVNHTTAYGMAWYEFCTVRSDGSDEYEEHVAFLEELSPRVT